MFDFHSIRKPNRNGSWDGSLLIWLVTKYVNGSRAFVTLYSLFIRPSSAQPIMSANALPATIVALGAAGMSYCMPPHLDILFFLCPARHHVLYTFSRLLLQSQGTYPQFRSANWRALNPRDSSRRSRNQFVDTAQVTMHSFPTKSRKTPSTRQKRTLGSHPSSCKTVRFV